MALAAVEIRVQRRCPREQGTATGRETAVPVAQRRLQGRHAPAERTWSTSGAIYSHNFIYQMR
ncbi:hypothetical protein ABZ896_45980, partial [Streptomyces sp. NPDC047072]|uniref:hypothetical protein n=1 Tax=Streptomyces sp. NPDC047072 TaxID=3154809 RepID=UPI0033E97391